MAKHQQDCRLSVRASCLHPINMEKGMDCELIGWCALKPEVQAAWVQAVGSIAGIALAIWLPMQQRKHDKAIRAEDRLNQANNIAIAIQPFVDAYRRRAQHFKQSIAQSDQPVSIRADIPLDAFDIAPTLATFQESFFLLKEDGEVANQFVASLFWLQQALHAIYHGVSTPKLYQQILKDCENTIDLALKLSAALESRVGKPDRRPASD